MPASAPQPAHQPTPRHSADIDFRRLWFAIRSGWKVMVAFVLLSLAAAFVVLHRTTPVYQAKASIRLYGSQVASSPLDQLKNMTSSSAPGVTTDMEVLRSRSLAEAVVDSLRLELRVAAPASLRRTDVLALVRLDSSDAATGVFVLGKPSAGVRALKNRRTGATVATVASGGSFSVGGVTATLVKALPDEEITLSLRPRSAAADTLMRSITLSRPGRDADVLVLSATGTDPEVVRDVPNALVESFIVMRKKAKRASAEQTAAFIQSQLDTLNGQLRVGEDSMQNFRESNRVVDLGTEATSQVGKLAELRAQHDESVAELSSLRRLLDEINSSAQKSQETSPYRRLLAFPTLMRNVASSDLLRALNDADISRATLRARRTQLDPDFIAADERVTSLEQQVKSMVQTYMQGLSGQIQATEQTLTRFGEDLQKIPAKEIESVRLERSTKVMSDMYALLQQRLKEAQLAAASEEAPAALVDRAILPERPIWPRRLPILVVALAVGLSLGAFVNIMKDWTDKAIHTHSDVEALTGVDNLGLIPSLPVVSPEDMDKSPVSPALVTGRDPTSIASESYRTLRSNIVFAHAERPHPVIAFTSPAPGDGKTTTIGNVATSLAQQGHRVLLIDADMRRGMLHALFGVDISPGLSDMASGARQPGQVIKRVEIDGVGSLDLIPSGKPPSNPSELLGSPSFKAWLDETAPAYEYVLIDTPPVNLFTDAAVLSRLADSILLVTRAGKTQKGEIAFAVDTLRRVSAPLVGSVLNDINTQREAKYGDGHYYKYGHHYGAYAAYGSKR